MHGLCFFQQHYTALETLSIQFKFVYSTQSTFFKFCVKLLMDERLVNDLLYLANFHPTSFFIDLQPSLFHHFFKFFQNFFIIADLSISLVLPLSQHIFKSHNSFFLILNRFFNVVNTLLVI